MLDDIKVLDQAIIDKLVACAFLPSTTPTPIPVYYINPEEEFTIEEFPSIIVYRVGEVRDGDRITLAEFRDNYTDDANGVLDSISVRESPLPVNFLYVIRLYYEFNQDGADMNLAVLKNFPMPPKPCFVTIGEDDYDLVFIMHNLFKSTSKEYGTIHFKDVDERRVFCDQYMYFCCVDLDIFDRTDVKTVKEIDLRLTTS